MSYPGGLGGGGPLLHDEDELEPEQLVEGEAPPGEVLLLEVLGGVDLAEGVGPPYQLELVDEPRWHHLGHRPGPFQRLGDVGGDLRRADLRLARLRVHRYQPARLVPDQVHDRIGHLAGTSVDLGAPEHDNL